jgi:hypothetical protein
VTSTDKLSRNVAIVAQSNAIKLARKLPIPSGMKPAMLVI